MDWIEKRLKGFKDIIEEDYNKKLINEFQYKAIYHELDSSTDNDYKFGLFIMYLLLNNK